MSLTLVGLHFGAHDAFCQTLVVPRPQSNSQQESEEAKPEEKPSAEDDNQEPAPKTMDRAERNRLRRQKRLENTKRSESFVSVFDSVVASTRDSVVEITDGKKRIALGAIVDNAGFVLTKASELKGKLECVLSNGEAVKPAVYGIDPETDLTLLKIDNPNLPALQFAESTDIPKVGSWLATVHQEETPLAVGIVSHLPRKIDNNVPNSAFIGITPVDAEETGVRINRIFNDSSASKSGLLVNDVIISIDDTELKDTLQLREILSNFQPGDEITLTIIRGEEEIRVPLTLGKYSTNPMMDRSSRQNRMGSTLSKRRSDFPLALQQDASLNANECGGPVVDLDGNVIGINIARDGRVSTLVLPNEIVLPVIKKLKTGRFTPEIVNREEIERIEKRIVDIDKQIGDLPNQKTKKDIEFSAGAAIEDEIRKQIKDLEEKLSKLENRYKEQRKANRKVSDSISEIQRRLNQIEGNRERLESDLMQLTTGVR